MAQFMDEKKHQRENEHKQQINAGLTGATGQEPEAENIEEDQKEGDAIDHLIGAQGALGRTGRTEQLSPDLWEELGQGRDTAAALADGGGWLLNGRCGRDGHKTKLSS